MPFESRPSAMTCAQFRRLLDRKRLSLTDAGAVAHRDRRTIMRYLSGETPIDHGVVALIEATEPRKGKDLGGRPPNEPAPKQRKAKR